MTTPTIPTPTDLTAWPACKSALLAQLDNIVLVALSHTLINDLVSLIRSSRTLKTAIEIYQAIKNHANGRTLEVLFSTILPSMSGLTREPFSRRQCANTAIFLNRFPSLRDAIVAKWLKDITVTCFSPPKIMLLSELGVLRAGQNAISELKRLSGNSVYHNLYTLGMAEAAYNDEPITDDFLCDVDSLVGLVRLIVWRRSGRFLRWYLESMWKHFCEDPCNCTTFPLSSIILLRTVPEFCTIMRQILDKAWSDVRMQSEHRVWQWLCARMHCFADAEFMRAGSHQHSILCYRMIGSVPPIEPESHAIWYATLDELAKIVPDHGPIGYIAPDHSARDFGDEVFVMTVLLSDGYLRTIGRSMSYSLRNLAQHYWRLVMRLPMELQSFIAGLIYSRYTRNVRAIPPTTARFDDALVTVLGWDFQT